MNTRRYFLASVTAAILGLMAGPTFAAPPTVEIVAMAHPPVQAALKPLRDWLAQQGGKFKVIEIDAESVPGEKRLEAVGLKGHVPIVILIDGQYRHPRRDGSKVAFVNFPAVKESPAGIRGDWLTEDVEAVLTERMKKP